MEHRNLVSWNAKILFGNHGFRRKAMEVLVKMTTTGVKPDFVTFVGLLTACNHAELVDEGRVYFQFHGRNLWGFSSNRGFFSSLIDLLGRAGRLKEADEYMKKFPFGHDPSVSDEMRDGVAEAWKLLKGSGLKKEPGHSLIEVKGTTEKFAMVDFSYILKD